MGSPKQTLSQKMFDCTCARRKLELCHGVGAEEHGQILAVGDVLYLRDDKASRLLEQQLVRPGGIIYLYIFIHVYINVCIFYNHNKTYIHYYVNYYVNFTQQYYTMHCGL